MKNTTFLILIPFFLLTVSCQLQETPAPQLNNPQLNQIRLTDGPWFDAMELDRAWLESIDPDRLLHHFRKTAGIEPKGPEYGGWEMEWRELRGHSIGHYLSAAARMSQLTDNSLLAEKCESIINELALCQKTVGTGYLSAFPSEYLDRVEQIEEVWAPYYTLHKILAGLLDTYTYLDNKLALETALQLSHYLDNRIRPLGKEQFQKVLDHTEQGGMNEVFWNLYATSGDTVCRNLALAFYQESYFVPMLNKEDKLKGLHSNSLIPNVVGLAREYEITGDISRRQVSEWFWKQVKDGRTYTTGGTSNGEHWNTEPGHLENEMGAGAHETCCTHNLIKLSDHLWGWDHQVRYQDYMERALINGILATQNCETGMPMYYVSMAPGYYKTWSTPDSSFWCCTGTGMENFARIAEYLYEVKDNRLYINQFASSTLDYSNQGFKLIQKTDLPKGTNLDVTLECAHPVNLQLAIRIPSWTDENYRVQINGKILDSKPAPGSYLLLDRKWKNGDQLSIELTPTLWYDLLPANNEHVAFGYGPVVLSATFDDAAVKDSLRHRYGPYDGTPVSVPVIEFSTTDFEQYIELKDPENLLFQIKTHKGESITLKPFYEVGMEAYSIYLPVSKNATSPNNKQVDPSVHI